MNKLECTLSGNGSRKYRERRGKRKRKRNTGMMMMMTMTRMMMRHITRPNYNDNIQIDPEFRPTRRELREADKEGDS